MRAKRANIVVKKLKPKDDSSDEEPDGEFSQYINKKSGNNSLSPQRHNISLSPAKEQSQEKYPSIQPPSKP